MAQQEEVKVSGKGEPQLNSDEWLMYESLTAAASQGGTPAGQSLFDFFANVHQKVTQNVTEMHVLAAQSGELRQALLAKQH